MQYGRVLFLCSLVRGRMISRSAASPGMAARCFRLHSSDGQATTPNARGLCPRACFLVRSGSGAGAERLGLCNRMHSGERSEASEGNHTGDRRDALKRGWRVFLPRGPACGGAAGGTPKGRGGTAAA